jgi:hypothetical protein
MSPWQPERTGFGLYQPRQKALYDRGGICESCRREVTGAPTNAEFFHGYFGKPKYNIFDVLFGAIKDPVLKWLGFGSLFFSNGTDKAYVCDRCVSRHLVVRTGYWTAGIVAVVGSIVAFCCGWVTPMVIALASLVLCLNILFNPLRDVPFAVGVGELKRNLPEDDAAQRLAIRIHRREIRKAFGSRVFLTYRQLHEHERPGGRSGSSFPVFKTVVLGLTVALSIWVVRAFLVSDLKLLQ